MQVHSNKQQPLLKILRTLSITLIITVILPLNASAKQLPDLGNTARMSLSVSEEKLIGDMWMQQLRAANAVCADPIINAYLNNLGQRLLAHAAIKDFNFLFFCIEDYSINAFAFFGGHIGVHKGLILTSQNENELAAAMAHEIAHASQAHLLRMLVKNKQFMPITVAGALASTLLGLPDLAIPILASHTQRMINFTREHEQEADNVGMQLLADAGFDPQSMATLFARMEKQSKYNGQIPEYLLTHPVFETRISQAQHRANRFRYIQRPSSFNYHLIKAHIEGTNPTNKQEILASCEECLANKRYANKAAATYGYAIALATNNNYQQASTIMAPLAQQYPNNLIIQLGMIDLEIVNNKQLALEKMTKLLPIFPDDPALLLKYAATAIATNNAALAKPCLQKLIKTKSPDPSAYQLLAQAESLTGNQLGVHLSTAEWNVLYGEFAKAIIQFNMALELAKNNPEQKKTLLEKKTAVEKLQKKKIAL